MPHVLLVAVCGFVALTAGSACVPRAVGAFCMNNSDCLSDMCGPENVCVVPSATINGGSCNAAVDCPSGTNCDVKNGQCYVPPSTGTADGGTAGQSCTVSADCPVSDYCTTNLVCTPIPSALPNRASCSALTPCGAGQICVAADALCAAALDASCAADADCPTGTVCDAAGARVCYRI
jgi:hypothetical protein